MTCTVKPDYQPVMSSFQSSIHVYTDETCLSWLFRELTTCSSNMQTPFTNNRTSVLRKRSTHSPSASTG
jgi:hypothetical protein